MDELKVSVSKGEGTPTALVVSVGGGITIQTVGELRDCLLQALAGAEQLCLDLSGVTEIDLAGLQLLCAAHRSSLHSNKLFCISAGENGIANTAVIEAGFQRHMGCSLDKDNACLWVGGND